MECRRKTREMWGVEPEEIKNHTEQISADDHRPWLDLGSQEHGSDEGGNGDTLAKRFHRGSSRQVLLSHSTSIRNNQEHRYIHKEDGTVQDQVPAPKSICAGRGGFFSFNNNKRFSFNIGVFGRDFSPWKMLFA